MILYNRIGFWKQLIISICIVIAFLGLSYYAQNFLSYRAVALVLLFGVSAIAMLFDIIPVCISAIISAFAWNFFFIPPTFTFHITKGEDILLFSLYFVIALLNGILNYKIRIAQRIVQEKEEKEKAIQLYNTLFSSLSHELKTPIATIMGSVDMLQHNMAKLSAEHQKELLQQMALASEKLHNQVENLLHMSRLESGTLQPTFDWFDINELMEDCIRNQQDQLNRISFLPNNEMPLVKLDYGLLKIAVDNIIINALNYSPVNSIIQVKVLMGDELTLLTVADHGLGIPVSERKLVLEKFYRIQPSKINGNGLGLAIVDAIVKAHNGVIDISDNIPCGTKITLQLPLETSYIRNINYE
jgi:two-component system sensor histidine kinase KdpD